jgi:ElaB/YqjD/DUF883 family membrane-anchored ribosome-binding protein
MGEAEREVGPPVTAPSNGERTPEDIEREIERTREELGETVAALAQKTDVKARVHDKVEETKSKITGKVEQAGPSNVDPSQVANTAKETASKPPTMIAGAFVAGLVIGILIAKRRANR